LKSKLLIFHYSRIYYERFSNIVQRVQRRSHSVIYKTQRSHYFYIWLSILTALAVLGAYGLISSFFISPEILEFNKDTPWAMMISTYVFFVVSSTGLCIVTSLGHVFGRRDYKLIGKRGVFLAIITIIFGMFAIMLHLGHPERSFFFYLTPNIGSAIWGMSFFYTFYILFIMIEYWLLARAELAHIANTSKGWKQVLYGLAVFGIRDESHTAVDRDNRFAKWTGIAAMVAGLSAHSTLGAVFGHAEAMPYWYGTYYPIYFLLSAAFSGFAWMIAVVTITYRIQKKEMSHKLKELVFEMGHAFVILLGAGMLFTLYKITSGVFHALKAKTVMLFLNGPFSIPFFTFEIAVGTVIPVLLLLYSLKRKWMTGLMIASIMALTGLFFMRYDFVVAGQIYPTFNNIPLPATVVPTLMEQFVIAGIFGGLLLSYTLAVKFLPLEEKEH
jgi:Ni/Fe-hydrogenase subunit HybB-like protein